MKRSDRWWANQEEKIYDEQYKRIKRSYGKHTADKANYGWFVDAANELCLSVCTKVYGFGVLTSSVSSDGVIHHNMEES